MASTDLAVPDVDIDVLTGIDNNNDHNMNDLSAFSALTDLDMTSNDEISRLLASLEDGSTDATGGGEEEAPATATAQATPDESNAATAMDVDGDGDGDGDDNEEDDPAEEDEEEEKEEEEKEELIAEPSVPVELVQEYRERVAARLAKLHPHLDPPSNESSVRKSIVSYSFSPLYHIPQNLVSISTLAVPPCASHLFTSGSDGYVRKYDWYTSLRRKTRSGERQPVLQGYWENPSISAIETLSLGDMTKAKFGPTGLMGVVGAPAATAVHSLVLQREEMFCLAGSAEGVINLFGVRLDEGQCRFSLGLEGKGHVRGKAVSALALNDREDELVSGGWDSQVLQWSLNNGKMVRGYVGHTSQIVHIAFRPASKAGIWKEPFELPDNAKGDSSQSSSDKTLVDATDAMDTDKKEAENEGETENNAQAKGDQDAKDGDAPAEKDKGAKDGDKDKDDKNKDSDADSTTSFDPLFDDDGDIASVQASNRPSPSNALEVLDTDVSLPSGETKLSLPSLNLPASLQPREDTPVPVLPAATSTKNTSKGPQVPKPPTLPKIEKPSIPSFSAPSNAPLSDDVFFSLSADGECLIWDRKVEDKEKCARRLDLPKDTPPWSISAVWSISGVLLFVGRRSASVDVYDIDRHSMKTLRLPAASGKVTALQPMPNNRHLIIASNDTVRLWDLQTDKFTIIPGAVGSLTTLRIDAQGKYLFAASGGRGWIENGKEEVNTFSIKAVEASDE